MARRSRHLLLAVSVLAGLVVAAPVDVGRAQTGVEVLWMWSGAITPRTAVVKAKVRGTLKDLHLVVDTDRQLQGGARFPLTGRASPDASGVVTFSLDRLTPNAHYYYAVEDGDARSDLGEFTTFSDGPMSFQFAAAACAGGNILSRISNHPIFTTIEERRPLFFLHMGDLHYSNINRNDVQRFRLAYDRVLTRPRQASLYRRTPIVYIWDDHDYGPNDSDRTAASRPAARAAYDENVPHYPLVKEDDTIGTIQQEFTVGRIRFLVLDLRSEKDPISLADGPEKTALGLSQREWLDKALERAADDDVPLLFVVSSYPWVTRTGSREDGWQPYTWERRYVADLLDRHGLTHRMVMLSGDAHMLAIDDGTNTNYASSAQAGEKAFPILQAAPLDRGPSIKGGPYSNGFSAENHQFGWIDVRDDGQTVRVTLTGHDVRGGQVTGMRLTLICRDGGCAIDR